MWLPPRSVPIGALIVKENQEPIYSSGNGYEDGPEARLIGHKTVYKVIPLPQNVPEDQKRNIIESKIEIENPCIGVKF